MSHGGHREGAGRPPKSKERKVPITITLPPDYVEWLDTKGRAKRSATIRGLIKQAMKQNPLPPSE